MGLPRMTLPLTGAPLSAIGTWAKSLPSAEEEARASIWTKCSPYSYFLLTKKLQEFVFPLTCFSAFLFLKIMYSFILMKKRAILELSPLNNLPLISKSLNHPPRCAAESPKLYHLLRTALRFAEKTPSCSHTSWPREVFPWYLFGNWQFQLVF